MDVSQPVHAVFVVGSKQNATLGADQYKRPPIFRKSELVSSEPVTPLIA